MARIGDRLRRHGAVEQCDDLRARIGICTGSQRVEQLDRRCHLQLAFLPARADAIDDRQVVSPGTIRGCVAGCRMRPAAIVELRIGDRSHHRLGVLPADGLQRAPRIGDVDGLMADVAIVARAVTAEQRQALRSGQVADDSRGGDVGSGLVPRFHGPLERLTRLIRAGHEPLVDRGQLPVAGEHIAKLRCLEIVDRPEERQPAIGWRQIAAGQMHRMHHQHCMELEADRTRLDVAHTGEQQRGEQLVMVEPGPHARAERFEHFAARCGLDQANERLDRGRESHRVGLRQGDRTDRGAAQCRGTRDRCLQEAAPRLPSIAGARGAWLVHGVALR